MIFWWQLPPLPVIYLVFILPAILSVAESSRFPSTRNYRGPGLCWFCLGDSEKDHNLPHCLCLVPAWTLINTKYVARSVLLVHNLYEFCGTRARPTSLHSNSSISLVHVVCSGLRSVLSLSHFLISCNLLHYIEVADIRLLALGRQIEFL